MSRLSEDQMRLAAERRRDVVALHGEGFNFVEIGEKLGCSANRVWKDFQKALRLMPLESLEHMRVTTTAQLNRLLRAHMATACETGPLSVGSARIVLKALELHARINGYMAPVQLQPVAPDASMLSEDELEHRRQRLIEQILKQRAQADAGRQEQ